MRLLLSEAGNATMSPSAGLTLHNRRIPSKCFVIGALDQVSHYGRGMVVGFEICVCAVWCMLPCCPFVSSHTYTPRGCHAPSRGYDAVAQLRPSVLYTGLRLALVGQLQTHVHRRGAQIRPGARCDNVLLRLDRHGLLSETHARCLRARHCHILGGSLYLTITIHTRIEL